VDGSDCPIGRLLNNDLWRLRRIMTASMRCIEERWIPLCNECQDLGWLFIDGHGVKECKCRTRSDTWFVGLDDFHFGRSTRFAGEMIYRLLENVYAYRHQLVVTSQVDKEKLEQHWAEAGSGYGAAIMRRVSEIEGAVCLSMF
jgi:hypothetical protein